MTTIRNITRRAFLYIPAAALAAGALTAAYVRNARATGDTVAGTVTRLQGSAVALQDAMPRSLKVGDEVLFTGDEVKGKICISAMYSMMPKIYAMMYNARFPWLDDQCKSTHACPDGFNPLMYELHRIPRE